MESASLFFLKPVVYPGREFLSVSREEPTRMPLARPLLVKLVKEVP
jgi:hypothetical protein